MQQRKVYFYSRSKLESEWEKVLFGVAGSMLVLEFLEGVSL